MCELENAPDSLQLKGQSVPRLLSMIVAMTKKMLTSSLVKTRSDAKLQWKGFFMTNISQTVTPNDQTSLFLSKECD